MSSTLLESPSPSYIADTSSFRRRAERTVELRISWGDDLLEFVELSPPRAFIVGSAESGPPDFVLPERDALFARGFSLLSVEHGDVFVHVPEGAHAVRRKALPRVDARAASVIIDHSDGRTLTWLFAPPNGAPGAPEEAETESTIAIAPSAGSVLLARGESIDVHVGTVRFSVRLGRREAKCPRALLGDNDARPITYFGASLAAVAALVGGLAWSMPPFGLTDDDSLDRNRVYLMEQYLDASAEREHLLEESPGDAAKGGGGPSAAAASKEAGALGKVDSRQQNHRASGAAPGEPRPATSRFAEVQAAENFGVIGLLSSGSLRPTSAPWDDEGAGPVAVAGGFFGDIGESNGSGGLTIAGLGEGGGQRGDAIALGGIGTCSTGHCAGMGPGGFGVSTALAHRDHPTAVPRLRQNGDTTVNGSLPPEVIQRIVRQSFGRFRGCYEDGLRQNPNLEGRVTARFVISRDGSVASVQSGGTDLPDARVVSCVLRAYTSLSFPAPKDGIVRVTYPLMFSPAT
ncbi:MAG TPA: AgmX/PglI C-terminal domain-containing protein [Polyangiaceae bacterium]|nr:AgmX/PglI C-terminal domain-containing protein [Polyangiaceae bacterium]